MLRNHMFGHIWIRASWNCYFFTSFLRQFFRMIEDMLVLTRFSNYFRPINTSSRNQFENHSKYSYIFSASSSLTSFSRFSNRDLYFVSAKCSIIFSIPFMSTRWSRITVKKHLSHTAPIHTLTIFHMQIQLIEWFPWSLKEFLIGLHGSDNSFHWLLDIDFFLKIFTVNTSAEYISNFICLE